MSILLVHVFRSSFGYSTMRRVQMVKRVFECELLFDTNIVLFPYYLHIRCHTIFHKFSMLENKR